MMSALSRLLREFSTRRAGHELRTDCSGPAHRHEVETTEPGATGSHAAHDPTILRWESDIIRIDRRGFLLSGAVATTGIVAVPSLAAGVPNLKEGAILKLSASSE